MRIGLDAKRAFLNHTGLGNYSRTLLTSLARQFPTHEYHLYSPRIVRNRRTEDLFQPGFVHHSGPALLGAWWRSRAVVPELVKGGIDLYHGLSHEIPLGLSAQKIPSVVTIHDLIFRRYPEQYPWLDRQVYDRKFRYACTHADLVLAISEATRADILHYYAIPPEKVRVLYQACHPQFYEQISESVRGEVLQRYQLPADYLLYVGSLVARKNLLGIVQALALLKPSERIPLVIIGRGGRYRQQVLALAHKEGLNDALIWANDIAFEDFPAVYQRAAAMVYPSFCEGFGLPVLEALASGTPVITSNRSSLPEAGGPDSLQIDPAHPSELAEAIRKVLGDVALVSQMREKGRLYAQRFLPEQLTPRLMAYYQELV